ncbi:MAG: hypothetical protein HYT20_02990 [Candidatus Nealsonbacteria bacterium]|nr:hypothetical protein [Candidatus Nealsonbacteria bacterium]
MRRLTTWEAMWTPAMLCLSPMYFIPFGIVLILMIARDERNSWLKCDICGLTIPADSGRIRCCD